MNEVTRKKNCQREINLAADIANIERATEFVDQYLEELCVPLKVQTLINIAIDELFGNIAHYAYPEGGGQVCLRVETETADELEKRKTVLTFIDRGIPYDPLLKEDPDTGLSLEEREPGGLGIYMVKKSMDEISYEYKDGQNILRIKKVF